MKKRKLVLLSSFAAIGIYSAITGKGVFNKHRFKEQHNAVARYVESRYPGATYSPIEATAKGYMTTIRRIGKNNIMLYAFKSKDGSYIFHESEILNS